MLLQLLMKFLIMFKHTRLPHFPELLHEVVHFTLFVQVNYFCLYLGHSYSFISVRRKIPQRHFLCRIYRVYFFGYHSIFLTRGKDDFLKVSWYAPPLSYNCKYAEFSATFLVPYNPESISTKKAITEREERIC